MQKIDKNYLKIILTITTLIFNLFTLKIFINFIIILNYLIIITHHYSAIVLFQNWKITQISTF